jgi:glutamine cyclotransferase
MTRRGWRSAFRGAGFATPSALVASAALACVVLAATPDLKKASGKPPATSAGVARLKVKVLATKAHDAKAFTQGLLIEDGVLYESTGLYGASSVRRSELATQRPLARRELDPALFGEGLAKIGSRLFLLTWQSELALIYEAESLVEIDRRTYRGEGWGLTWDGLQLIQSDGSAMLHFRDPEDFRLQGSVQVTLDGRPLANLNELEFVDGRIYANVWGEDWLVRIDPATGKVDAMIDATGLLTAAERRDAEVLNGIAWDARAKTFWITGKLWPKLFQVAFEKAPASGT